MKVLISLLVHECRRVIEDQLQNFLYFFEEPTIILHLSRSYDEDTDFSMFPHVHVNPVRHQTQWGNIGYLHYANVAYSLDKKMPFEYVVFCSSNELYFRKGAESYLKTAKAFMDPQGIIKNGKFTYAPENNAFYTSTALITKAFTDKKLLAFIKKYNLPGMCKSQIEGSAYHRSVITKMVAMMKKNFGFAYMRDVKWCGEELLLPTVFLAVNSKMRVNVRRPFSFADWSHDFTPGLTRRAIRYWCGRNDVAMTAMLKSIKSHRNIYAVKGVKRTYYNRLRNFIRRLTPRARLTIGTKLAYCNADILYNFLLMKKEMKPRRILLHLGYGILGMLSRIMGKQKSYLKWKLKKPALAFFKRIGINIG